MAYEVVMSYHLHMPSYFLGTFTEYPYVMNKKGLSRLCSCFCLFAHRGICYGIACGGVLFLVIFVAVFGFPVWVSELFEKRMEARRKIE